MTFALDDDQKAIRDLVRQVLTDACSKEKLDAIERDGGFFAGQAWRNLSDAGLIGMLVDEAHGGGGLGVVEGCVLLVQCGAHVAPIPALDTVMLGAPAIARFGDEATRKRWLGGLLTGTTIAACALIDGVGRDALSPQTRAIRSDDGTGWHLYGERSCVPWPEQADVILVPARDDDGPGLWLIDAQAAGIARKAQTATNGEPLAHMTLAEVEATRLGGADALKWLVDRTVLGRCALALGVAKMALGLTGEHCRTREQFGAPIGSFQAVTQRAADMYIDVQLMELSLWHAASLLGDEQPGDADLTGMQADAALATARYWATEAGHRVVAAAQHLHGGMGFDRDYPLHRCFLTARRLELGLGTAREALAGLGGLLV